ncbi:MAG TPA: hypothetical protein VID48_01300 [Solirubrobacteraceae bacterium]
MALTTSQPGALKAAKTGSYEREAKALRNFSSTPPAPDSELVGQIVHEDYNF